MKNMTNCKEIIPVLSSLISDNKYDVSILANTSSLLYENLGDVNWVGFYLAKDDGLHLGPFCGKPACIFLPYNKGVCAYAATTKKSVVVKDVHEFKGHIACDSASNSEICIPLFINDKLYAILDIDSPIINRFNEDDLKNLEDITNILVGEIKKTNILLD